MARPRKLFLLTILILFAASIPSCFLFRQYRARAAQRELAILLPQIASIILYDIDFGKQEDRALTTAISAPFPVDVFTRAASASHHRGGITKFLGSSLAILTLRDGSQRRARFSYHGGFFTLDDISRRFVVPGGSSSEFHQRYIRVIQEEFIPRRVERNRSGAR